MIISTDVTVKEIIMLFCTQRLRLTAVSVAGVLLLSVPFARPAHGSVHDIIGAGGDTHRVIRVDPEKAQTIRTVVGNLSIVSQGGRFVVDYADPEETVVIMLDGVAEVAGVELRSGETMWMRQDLSEKIYTVIFPLPTEYFSDEILAVLWDNREYLEAEVAESLPEVANPVPSAPPASDDDLAQEDGSGIGQGTATEPPPTTPDNGTGGIAVHPDLPQLTPDQIPPTDPDTDKGCINGIFTIASTEDFALLAGSNNPRLACRIELVADVQVPADMVIETPLTGAFNGNGHTLLLANDIGHRNESALFHTIASTGRIHDLVLQGTVRGQDRMGALATTNHGTLVNIHSHAHVSAINSAGGLVFENHGHISGVAVTGDVISRGGSNYGGIASVNHGRISHSYTTGRVQAANTAGGIVAINESEGRIDNAYATGVINANDSGGLVALNHGRVSQSLAVNHEISGANARAVIGRGNTHGIDIFTHGGIRLNANPIGSNETLGQGTLVGTGDLTLDFWASYGFSSPVWQSDSHELPILNDIVGSQWPQLPYFPDSLLGDDNIDIDPDDWAFLDDPNFDLDPEFNMDPLLPELPDMPDIDDEFEEIETAPGPEDVIYPEPDDEFDTEDEDHQGNQDGQGNQNDQGNNGNEQ